MKKRILKESTVLVNGETFRFDNDNTLYEVFDFIKYRKYKSKNKGKLIPQNKIVEVFKQF